MSDRPDIASFLTHPARIAALTDADVATLLLKVSEQEAKLVALRSILAARLAALSRIASVSDRASATGRLLDARTVASVLDVRPHAVYELHRTGKLPGVRIGTRRLRFREEDVLALRGGTRGDSTGGD